MPTQQAEYRNHRFAFDSSVRDVDSACVDVHWRIEDCATDSLYAIAHAACTEWKVALRQGRADTTMIQGILCLPPIAPRGRSLFANVRVVIDRNEDICSVECKVKAIKTPGLYTAEPDGRYTPWPSKREWKTGEWCPPIRFQDGVSIYPGYMKYRKREFPLSAD